MNNFPYVLTTWIDQERLDCDWMVDYLRRA